MSTKCLEGVAPRSLESALREPRHTATSTSSVTGMTALAIGYERAGIERYGDRLDELPESDAVAHRLLTRILAHKLAREDEIEAVTGEVDGVS